MQRIDHALLCQSLGSQKTLTSFHFGTPGSGTKVTIQASLHAEELPGMLAAYHLRPLLEAADAAGLIQGEVVLVPVANPIGLSQRLDHKPMGRFELDTSENFNRHYPDFAKEIAAQVIPSLGADAKQNVGIVRAAMGDHLKQWNPQTELQNLRHTLLSLAFDADYFLDLHCDCEGVLHFYCEEPCWENLEPLSRFLGSETSLLAKNSGSGPIDECLSGVWWRLAEMLQAQNNPAQLPQGCYSTTIELRGELDVTHANASTDAQAIVYFLQHIGVLVSKQQPALPAPRCKPTPLAGSETLRSAVPGVIVFAAQPGQILQAGDLVAEVIDPIENKVHRVCTSVNGVFYARVRDRYTTSGGEIGKVASATAFKTGELLGA